MSHYTHLSTSERERAMVYKAQGMSIRAIGRELNRSASTISRELKRNSSKEGEYSAERATKQYHHRRKVCKRKLLFEDTVLAKYVIERLNMQWSPEQIAGRARLEGYAKAFSYISIYRAVANRILPISLHKQMRIKSGRRSHKTGDKRGKVQDATPISQRPKSVAGRKRIGHWESDTVFGQRKTGCIGTHVERKTGYLVAFKLNDRKNKAFNTATIKAFQDIPDKYKKTFTVDRGVEFYHHKELAEALQAKIYFCDPYSAWQRGTNENTNGLLRQYFPKDTSFEHIDDDVLNHVVFLLNNRPRKRLNFRTPAELFLKCCT